MISTATLGKGQDAADVAAHTGPVPSEILRRRVLRRRL